jgi:hypothetical protein
MGFNPMNSGEIGLVAPEIRRKFDFMDSTTWERARPERTAADASTVEAGAATA